MGVTGSIPVSSTLTSVLIRFLRATPLAFRAIVELEATKQVGSKDGSKMIDMGMASKVKVQN